jgi:hypothetical protein
MKWSLLVALLVVVVLGLPRGARAGQPNVQPPTGNYSGGVFYGPDPYTFATNIYCVGGPSYNSSYSNALEGTHTFTFKGAPDGSLLVSIDGGGLQLVNSCGDPFAPPATTVATYTVTYHYSSPPPPTPTPTPTPTPMPTPTPSPHGGSSTPTPPPSGGPGGSGGQVTPAPDAGTPAPVEATPTPTASAGPSASPAPVGAVHHSPSPSLAPAPARARWWESGWLLWLLVLLAVLLTLWRLSRSPRIRQACADFWLRVWFKVEPFWLRLKLATRRILRVRGHDQPKSPGLSAHEHSGKVLAHHHTSYPSLFFLVIVSSVLLAAYSVSSQAANTDLSLTVLGPPPSQGATIDQPLDGDHVTSATITVRGTCPNGLMVEVYRNGSFAGSAFCDPPGLYTMLITLVPGRNDLVAKDLDGLGQYGPDSATVTVWYDVPPPPTPTPTPTPSAGPHPSPTPRPTPPPTPRGTPQPGVAPFLLDVARHYYTGLAPGDEVRWALSIQGGTAPYSIDWDWGDGTKQPLAVGRATTITPSHTYRKAGIYRLVVRGRDAAGHEAALTLVAVVSGPAPAVSSVTPFRTDGILLIAWPLLAATGLVILSFWLGEHHKLAVARAEQQSTG